MGSLLMLSQDYRWLQWLDTTLTSVQTHTHTRARLLVHAYTHTFPLSHTHTHTFSFLSGSHRCTYAHKPPTSANKLTHPVIPLSTSLDLLCSCTHTRTHTLTQSYITRRVSGVMRSNLSPTCFWQGYKWSVDTGGHTHTNLNHDMDVFITARTVHNTRQKTVIG